MLITVLALEQDGSVVKLHAPNEILIKLLELHSISGHVATCTVVEVPHVCLHSVLSVHEKDYLLFFSLSTNRLGIFSANNSAGFWSCVNVKFASSSHFLL